jgi:hypothetical protein
MIQDKGDCGMPELVYKNRRKGKRERDNSSSRNRNIRFSGDSKGHENTIPINLDLPVKEMAKKTIEENQLVFDRLSNL